ncbi:Down syndrome cell adhesion molecule homolog [Diaphorina citri]|uniref:Down syndrome cell adhesion molecule homolog n=1 Tax=Diaphorina citri TaxID=121845 RepID=A0A1S3D080_DIACI|nr:Down syndrome cell adhesion molecule homolog [Diaphorina citri]XP_026678459.1 Down syndrome cell adhesion molecule homolog [Diaphorina citri]
MCLNSSLLYYFLYAVCLFGISHSSINLQDSTPSSTPYKEYWLDVGTNITLLCNLSGVYPNSTQWIRDGRHEDKKTEFIADGNFVILNVTKENEGFYTCTDEDDDSSVFVKYKLHVRQTPGPVQDVKVVARSVMAYIMWSPGDSGGYDVTNYTVQYRVKYGFHGNRWQHIHPNIELKPSSTFVDIYLLEPNTTYIFRIWANNKLGAGEIVQVEALTKHDNTEIQLARHLLIGLEDFDTRIWLGAVAFVLGTLLVLIIAILWLFLRECRSSPSLRKPRLRTPDILKRIRTSSGENARSHFGSDEEIIELVPNIICNPTFDEDGPRRDGSHL